MSFNVYGTQQNESKKEVSVDYDALNRYLVETAGLQERETLIGVVSAIVDLGTQKQPDAEMEFKGDENDEKEEVAKYPNTYFKDGYDPQTKKPVRLKCWPQKDIQAVAVAIDFPDIQINKGTFFGDAEAKSLPLRLWLGDQFYNQTLKKMVVARPTYLKINKKLGSWSFDQKHLFYKMAVAAKLIKPGEVFLPQDIDKLLGQAFQFEAQVGFKRSQKDGKDYYFEYVKYVSGLGRGQNAPESPVKPYLVQFNVENDPQAVKEIRASVLNTCRLASNWEGSVLQRQVEEIRPSGDKKQQEKQPPQKQEELKNLPFSVDDFDNVPF